MKRIRTKITITYLVLALLIVGGVSVIAGYNVESFFKKQLVTDLSRQADYVLLLLQNNPSLAFEGLNEQIRRIAGLEQIRITLIEADGHVVADSDVPITDLPSVQNHLSRPEVQEAIRKGIGHESRHSATVGRDFLYVAKRIEKPLGGTAYRNLHFIRLSMPLEEVRAQINDIRWNIFLAGVLVLVVIVWVSVAISGRVATPMIQIARSAERIRSGHLDERIEIVSDDEIGQVAQAVNELVDKLKLDIVQLRRLEQIRKEFLGNVSHELRTPIFAIQGFLETLLNGAVDDPTVNRSFLQKAQFNAERLNTLLEDLINISQIESGEMRMSFRYFSLNEFLESVLRDFQPAAEQKKVSLKLDARTAPGTEIFGDRERLHQAMANLIDNGLKYSRGSGEVRLIAEDSDGRVTIKVQDTGVGIAAEHLPRIFERFYRVDQDRSREVGGTGLGLAIVKHIIEAHGSKVTVTSVVGEGSTFQFKLKRG